MLRIPEVLLLLLVFHGYHQGATTTADTCCKYNRSHSTYSCHGCQLTEVPNDIPNDVLTLDLNKNNLTLIKDLTFSKFHKLKMLYLNNNQIRYFGQDALRGLQNLKELDVRRNQLCVNDTNFNQVFNHTPHLRTLQLVSNRCKNALTGYINVALSPLKELEKISLPYIKDGTLGSVFRKLTSLKYLMLIGSDANGGILGCDAFKALENISLEMLSVRNSGLQEICPTALKPLRKLKYLNLACNADLLYANVLEAVNNLPASTLDTIIIDRVGGGTLSIDTTHDNVLPAWNNVRKFSMRSLNTRHIDYSFSSCWYNLPELRYLVLAANMIWPADDDLKNMIEFYNTTKLEAFDRSYYSIKYDEEEFNKRFCYPDDIHTEQDLFFRKLPEGVFIPIPPQHNDFDLDIPDREGRFRLRNMPLSLKYLFIDFFTFGMMDAFKIQFNPLNQLLMINCSNSNFFGRFKSLRNMTNLQIMDARNCEFNNLDIKPLQYPSMSKLILSGNNIKYIGSEMVKWSPFQKLKKLKHIDLINNKISYIKSSAFKDLPLLEEIKLRKNTLTIVDLDLTGSPRVSLIDVSQNKITSVTDTFMQSIDQISEKNEILLDLRDNELDCGCQSLQFVKWFQQTRVQIIHYDKIRCQDGTHIHAKNTHKMTLTCFMTRAHLSIVLPTLIPTGLVVFMLALLYRKRWKLQFRYYLLKDYLRRRKKRSSGTHDDEPGILLNENEAKDVFISCSYEDNDWLYEEAIPRIEELWGYTTYSRHRDEDLGNLRTLSVGALNSAAICMCVISPNFCEDEICLWELQMILAKSEESILFFCKDEIDSSNDPFISKVTQHYNHLKYGNGEEERQLCWDRLKQRIHNALTDAASTGSA